MCVWGRVCACVYADRARHRICKVHFRIDESGMVTIDKAEAVFEREPIPEPEPKSLLEKASSWFGFGGDDNATNATEPAANATDGATDGDEAAGDGDEKAPEEPPTPDESSATDDKATAEDGKAPEEETPTPEKEDDTAPEEDKAPEDTPTPDDDTATDGEGSTDQKEAEESKEKPEKTEETEKTPDPDGAGGNSTEADSNATDVNGTAAPKANATIETNATLKKIVIKEPLVATFTPSDIADFDGEALVAAQARIQALVVRQRMTSRWTNPCVFLSPAPPLTRRVTCST